MSDSEAVVIKFLWERHKLREVVPLKKLCAFFMMVVFTTGVLRAETYTWDGDSSGASWATASHWRSSQGTTTAYPKVNDTAVINSGMVTLAYTGYSFSEFSSYSTGVTNGVVNSNVYLRNATLSQSTGGKQVLYFGLWKGTTQVPYLTVDFHQQGGLVDAQYVFIGGYSYLPQSTFPDDLFNVTAGYYLVDGTIDTSYATGETAGGEINVGFRGATGLLDVSGNSRVIAPRGMYIGGLNGHGTLNVSGGSIEMTDTGNFCIGYGDYNFANARSAVGIFNLSGGTVSATTYRIGLRATGYVNQTGGDMTVSGSMYVGNTAAESRGQMNMQGGTLTVGETIDMSGPSSVVNHSGGTIRAKNLRMGLHNSLGATSIYNISSDAKLYLSQLLSGTTDSDRMEFNVRGSRATIQTVGFNYTTSGTALLTNFYVDSGGASVIDVTGTTVVVPRGTHTVAPNYGMSMITQKSFNLIEAANITGTMTLTPESQFTVATVSDPHHGKAIQVTFDDNHADMHHWTDYGNTYLFAGDGSEQGWLKLESGGTGRTVLR